MFEDASDLIGGVVSQHMTQTHHIENTRRQAGVPRFGAMHLYFSVPGFVEQNACCRDGIGLAIDSYDASGCTDHLRHLDRDETRPTSQVQEASTFGDTRQLPPMSFTFSSPLSHEPVPLDLTIGQCQGIPVTLTTTHTKIIA